MNISWYEREQLLAEITKKLEYAEVILDIGCGIRPQELIKPKVHICCEPFGQYIDYLQKEVEKTALGNYIIIKAKWQEAVEIFPPKSVDSIFLLDVIEHLNKEVGLKLLKPTEDIARRQIVIFTTLGFMPQEHPDQKDAWGFDGGVWQTHRSGWWPEDFDEQWDIFGCRDFHTHDNMANQLKVPMGAFWAIKTYR